MLPQFTSITGTAYPAKLSRNSTPAGTPVHKILKVCIAASTPEGILTRLFTGVYTTLSTNPDGAVKAPCLLTDTTAYTTPRFTGSLLNTLNTYFDSAFEHGFLRLNVFENEHTYLQRQPSFNRRKERKGSIFGGISWFSRRKYCYES